MECDQLCHRVVRPSGRPCRDLQVGPMPPSLPLSRLYYGEESNSLTEEIVNVCAGKEFSSTYHPTVVLQVCYWWGGLQSRLQGNCSTTTMPNSPRSCLRCSGSTDRPGLCLDANLRDYYLGGLDDMAAWTSLVWEQAAAALLGGTQVRFSLMPVTQPVLR